MTDLLAGLAAAVDRARAHTTWHLVIGTPTPGTYWTDHTACTIGDGQLHENPGTGYGITYDRAKVTCPSCLEWIHA